MTPRAKFALRKSKTVISTLEVPKHDITVFILLSREHSVALTMCARATDDHSVASNMFAMSRNVDPGPTFKNLGRVRRRGASTTKAAFHFAQNPPHKKDVSSFQQIQETVASVASIHHASNSKTHEDGNPAS